MWTSHGLWSSSCSIAFSRATNSARIASASPSDAVDSSAASCAFSGLQRGEGGSGVSEARGGPRRQRRCCAPLHLDHPARAERNASACDQSGEGGHLLDAGGAQFRTSLVPGRVLRGGQGDLGARQIAHCAREGRVRGAGAGGGAQRENAGLRAPLICAHSGGGLSVQRKALRRTRERDSQHVPGSRPLRTCGAGGQYRRCWCRAWGGPSSRRSRTCLHEREDRVVEA